MIGREFVMLIQKVLFFRNSSDVFDYSIICILLLINYSYGQESFSHWQKKLIWLFDFWRGMAEINDATKRLKEATDQTLGVLGGSSSSFLRNQDDEIRRH